MTYFLNTEIPDKKAVWIALRYVFGLGKNKSLKIINLFGISKTTKINNLSSTLKNQIIVFIEKTITINEELKQTLMQIKDQQQRLKTYKGQRSRFKLPRRGQRTHTNAKTVKKFY